MLQAMERDSQMEINTPQIQNGSQFWDVKKQYVTFNFVLGNKRKKESPQEKSNFTILVSIKDNKMYYVNKLLLNYKFRINLRALPLCTDWYAWDPNKIKPYSDNAKQ